MGKKLLSLYPKKLRTGVCALDGTHTRCSRNCQASGWQGRKKAITTNLLLLTDNQGLPLALAEPLAGTHNDLYQADKALRKMVDGLQQAGLRTQGIFLNADAGHRGADLIVRPCKIACNCMACSPMSILTRALDNWKGLRFLMPNSTGTVLK